MLRFIYICFHSVLPRRTVSYVYDSIDGERNVDRVFCPVAEIGLMLTTTDISNWDCIERKGMGKIHLSPCRSVQNVYTEQDVDGKKANHR
mmetsp:Transcript_570/g.1458  ORF Transcript_570/g.1458 Transcript_570/m.1458 type:complete len:90 (-) Transcript_570:1540-1809(-)